MTPVSVYKRSASGLQWRRDELEEGHTVLVRGIDRQILRDMPYRTTTFVSMSLPEFLHKRARKTLRILHDIISG